jgi:hypothetical protein
MSMRRSAMKPTKPTPLVVLACLLTERRGKPHSVFGEREAEGVRDALRRLAQTRQEQEAAECLIQAAKGGDVPGTGTGSLKHLLWWFPDHARELYETLARALLERAIENPDLPLHEGLASRLLRDAVLSAWARKALEGARQEALDAICERAGGAAPYPELRVCREGAPTLGALKAAAREVLSAWAERRPK